MSIGQGQNGDMTALLALHYRRKKGDCQRMLVIIRNKPSFDGVADRLPPLVVLIENMPAFHGGMLINDQHGPLKKTAIPFHTPHSCPAAAEWYR